LNHIPVIASYLSKVAYFNLFHLHLVSSLGLVRSNFAQTFSTRKLNFLELFMWLCLTVLTQCRRVTDRRTHDDSIFRAVVASRLK